MSNAGLEVDLVDAISYTLDNGAIGTMAATGSIKPGQGEQLELRYYGSAGYVLQQPLDGRADGAARRVAARAAGASPRRRVYPATHGPLPRRSRAGGGREPRAGRPAAATVEFLEAAYRSAREGRPIRVADLVA